MNAYDAAERAYQNGYNNGYKKGYEDGKAESKDKPCAWCKAEYTIIDDDFGQPVHPTKVKFCFNCGRRLR